MRLIGQFDSPFVRRVAVAMRILGLDFEHLPWSVFGDADKIAPFSPLLRVPILVLDGGEAMTESHLIIAYLDRLSGRTLWPQEDRLWTRALRITALSTGAADKAVSLVYERLLHDHPSPQWTERCALQLRASLDALESARRTSPEPYLFGSDIGHADIALACMLRFVGEAHPDRFDLENWPGLLAHARYCEARPDFAEICQPFKVTMKSVD